MTAMELKKGKWTAEEVAELKRLHGQGLSFRDIAGRLGRSEKSVYGKHSRLPGEERPRRCEQMLQWMAERYAETPNSEIAGKFGMKANAVWYVAKTHGLRKAPGYRKALYAKEKSRVVWGLPQKTNLRIGRQPVSKVQYRYRLRKYGYVEDAEDRNLFRYGPDLERRLEVEERAHARHRIRFLPIEEEAEEADEETQQPKNDKDK